MFPFQVRVSILVFKRCEIYLKYLPSLIIFKALRISHLNYTNLKAHILYKGLFYHIFQYLAVYPFYGTVNPKTIANIKCVRIRGGPLFILLMVL